jgi:hypothetical protein
MSLMRDIPVQRDPSAKRRLLFLLTVLLHARVSGRAEVHPSDGSVAVMTTLTLKLLKRFIIHVGAHVKLNVQLLTE